MPDISAVCQAIEAGQLSVLKRWKSKHQLPHMMQFDEHGVRVYFYAILSGRLKMLQWLVANSGQQIDISAEDNLVFRLAAENGSLETVRWLVEESHLEAAKNPAWTNCDIPKVDITAHGNEALRLALLNDHAEVVEYLLFQSRQLFQIFQSDTSWIEALASPQREQLSAIRKAVKILQEFSHESPEIFQDPAARKLLLAANGAGLLNSRDAVEKLLKTVMSAPTITRCL